MGLRSWHNSSQISNSSLTPRATDVHVGCLEVLRNYHKFELICKHLFPYFTENYNLSSQVPFLVRGRKYSPRWHQFHGLQRLGTEDARRTGSALGNVRNTGKQRASPLPSAPGVPHGLRFQLNHQPASREVTISAVLRSPCPPPTTTTLPPLLPS